MGLTQSVALSSPLNSNLCTPRHPTSQLSLPLFLLQSLPTFRRSTDSFDALAPPDKETRSFHVTLYFFFPKNSDTDAKSGGEITWMTLSPVLPNSFDSNILMQIWKETFTALSKHTSSLFESLKKWRGGCIFGMLLINEALHNPLQCSVTSGS